MSDPGRLAPERRSDPLIPILGSAVTLVCLGVVLLVFLPRLRTILAEHRAGVVRAVAPSDGKIPLWICRSEEGVALLIEPLEFSGQTADKALDTFLGGGEHQFLRLCVYNFGRDGEFRLDLPEQGFASPEGGPPLLPCGPLLPPTLTPATRHLMVGLGAVSSLTVPLGQHARALLAATAKDISNRTAFVSGGMTFERREVARVVLAAWHQSPALRQFLDF